MVENKHGGEVENQHGDEVENQHGGEVENQRGGKMCSGMNEVQNEAQHAMNKS